jgi:thiol-disulfide isomerase/thioredoxin
MKNRIFIGIVLAFLCCVGRVSAAFVLGGEYTGQFDPALVANTAVDERIVFKYDTGERLQETAKFDAMAHFTAGKLLDPRSQQYTLMAFLVEEKGKEPTIFIDLNEDRKFSADEKIVFKRNVDDTYIWNTTIVFPIKDGFFKTCPLVLKYYKNVTMDKMGAEDRLISQTTEVFARGQANVHGKNVIVQYAYNIIENKIDPRNGYLGVEADENGEIDLGDLSPEVAKADNEAVVFRVGDIYLSTKTADVVKNQIVLRENTAKDYKRIEVGLKKDFPDVAFTDFDGKKHKLSEFRGKYILLDIWGFWCGPCRRELPYIREAYKRYQSRNLEVVGFNTDDYTIESIKKSFTQNQMTWTQAQFESVREFLRNGLRVHSYPTTFLISPEGKILSTGQRDEPDLRGKELLETLDDILPKP